MKLLILCVLVMHAFHASGDDLHVRFLKTKSGCTFSYRTGELTVWSVDGRASWEFRLMGTPQLGRIHYPKGPLDRLVSPSRPMMPADALRGQAWSVRAADLAKGELGMALLLGEHSLVILDTQRSAAGAVYTVHGTDSTAGMSAWISDMRDGDVRSLETYQVRRMPGSGVHLMGWGALGGESAAAAVSAGWVSHEARPAYWWLNGSCSWDFPLTAGSFGLFAAPSDAPILAVDGTVCRELFVVQTEADFFPGWPISISAAYRYALELPDPWPGEPAYPGSIRAQADMTWTPGSWTFKAGGSWEIDHKETRCSLTWSVIGSEGDLRWGTSGSFRLYAPDDPWRFQAYGVKSWDSSRIRIALGKTTADGGARLTCSYTRFAPWGSITIEYGGDGSMVLLMTASL